MKNMRKNTIHIVLLLITFLYPPFLKGTDLTSLNVLNALNVLNHKQLYTEMQLENIINYTAFEQALAGYHKVSTKCNNIITLIDFTKPSTEERFYVLDIKQKKMLFSSHVSHGKNSGENYATSFSNQSGSYKSSLGFYLTGNTYYGKHGYSLILEGLEKGINDKAKERAIVIHGASYANPSAIVGKGRLGRSLGCPALPQTVSESIIKTIKDGSLLYIYANDKNYLDQSSFLSCDKSLFY
jgi:hypothetical protein